MLYSVATEVCPNKWNPSLLAKRVSYQFGPLEETYAILAKFEVSATEEEQQMLADLQQTGEDFKEMLKDVEQARTHMTQNQLNVKLVYGRPVFSNECMRRLSRTSACADFNIECRLLSD